MVGLGGDGGAKKAVGGGVNCHRAVYKREEMRSPHFLQYAPPLSHTLGRDLSSAILRLMPIAAAATAFGGGGDLWVPSACSLQFFFLVLILIFLNRRRPTW